MTKVPDNFLKPVASPQGYIQFRIRRATLYGALFSLLVHLLLLSTLLNLFQQPINSGEPPSPLQIVLAPATHPQMPTQPKPPEPLPREPEPKRVKPSPQKPVQHTSPLTAPIATPNNPPVIETPTKNAPPTPTKTSPPAMDFASFVNAKQQRRQAEEEAARQENALAAAQERGPTEEEQRLANLKRNINPGVNGVFQILKREPRTIDFAFRGWTEWSNSRREVFEVTVGLDEDIERATVRKMIELIRRYYKTDFNWESQRLGRVVVLSARNEDSEGLEEFLMREFFEARGRGFAP